MPDPYSGPPVPVWNATHDAWVIANRGKQG